MTKYQQGQFINLVLLVIYKHSFIYYYIYIFLEAEKKSQRQLPKAAFRGRLPKIKLKRQRDNHWSIADYIFATDVPDSELDCLNIVEKAVKGFCQSLKLNLTLSKCLNKRLK